MNADTLEPAYLLHLRRYRNTSALTDIFTPNHGRLGAVVKGIFSKGTQAQQLRGQLQLATPLLMAFTGRSELKSITHVEAVGHAVVDPGSQGASSALYCVMYLNELLVRLLPAQLSCPSLFAAYQLALEQLACRDNPELVLRRFELQLLDTLGYGIDFGVVADGEQPILAQGSYCFVPAMGFVSLSQTSGQVNEFVGSDLLAIGAGEFNGESTLRAAKRLMRLAINYHLNGRPLNSRALFKPPARLNRPFGDPFDRRSDEPFAVKVLLNASERNGSDLALQWVMDMMVGKWGSVTPTAGSARCVAEAIECWPVTMSTTGMPAINIPALKAHAANTANKDNNNMQGLALRLFKSRQKRPPEDDVALLAAIARGDQAALGLLYRQYHPRLFRFLSINVYDRDAIEEIINDTLHVVWQSSQQFRGESKVSTWIFGIAWRKSIAANQSTRKHRGVELIEADVASMQWQEQTQQSQLMQQALAQLSPLHRMVVELTYYGGFSYQEIGGIMNCPENTVKTRMFYARKHLQQLMQEDTCPAAAVPALAASVVTTAAVAAPLESASMEDA